MKNKDIRVVALGEVLWDLLPEGPRLGGAPANFATHAAQFGLDAQVVSAVGETNGDTKPSPYSMNMSWTVPSLSYPATRQVLSA